MWFVYTLVSQNVVVCMLSIYLCKYISIPEHRRKREREVFQIRISKLSFPKIHSKNVIINLIHYCLQNSQKCFYHIDELELYKTIG